MIIIAAATTSATSWLAPLVTVMGVLALGFILMLSLRDRIARRGPSQSARERIDQVKSRTHTVRDTNAGAGQMYGTAQRLASQLDNKAARLEQLIAAADERIARLGMAPAATPARRLDPAAASTASISPATAAPAAARRATPGAAATSSSEALRTAIYALADRGTDSVAIARQLDEQLGKIELILALRAERLAADG